jgi:hypothetical protein
MADGAPGPERDRRSPSRRPLALFLALHVASGALPLRGGTPPLPSDPGVAKGRAQIEEGDYPGAAETLQAALARLAKDPSPDRAQAQFYSAVALAATGRDEEARRLFGEALKALPGLTLEPGRFPAAVTRAYDAARSVPSPTPASPAPGPAAGGGGHKGAILLGAAAAGVFGLAVVARSGSTAPQAQDTRRVETFTGTLSADAGQRPFDVVVSTAGILDATVTWIQANVVFTVELDDERFTRLAISVLTSPVSSSLTAPVTPRVSAPDATYKVLIQRRDATPGPAAYTLTVTHP